MGTFHVVEGTEYHQRICEKAESFLMTLENRTHAVNHEKKDNLTMNLMFTF